jgi:hypothetical protein
MTPRTSQSTNTQNGPSVAPPLPGTPTIQFMDEPLPESAGEDDDDPGFISPRHRELLQQKVRLTSGVEMELRWALGLLDYFRLIQERSAEEFKAIVSVGKPKGARSLPGDVSAETIEDLKKKGQIQSDGTLRPDLATVLDAAYTETAEAVILVDPVIYPSREMLDELQQHHGEALTQLGRLAMRAAKKDGNNDEGNKSP